jgi:hypothetical protein
MPPANILILAQPKPGKEKRYEEVLEWWVQEVKDKEANIPVYHVRSTEDFVKGQKTFFVHMALVLITRCSLTPAADGHYRIADETALEFRHELPHHKELAKILKDEDLLADYKFMRMSGALGFMR